MNDFGDLMRILSNVIPLDMVISMINETTDAYLHATNPNDESMLLEKIELLASIILTKSVEGIESEKKSEDDLLDNTDDIDSLLAELKKRKPE
jgi:hypothetical protein